jgi:hypothetical protein
MSFLQPKKEEIVMATKTVYQVPLFKKNNNFMVWVGNGGIRHFDEETLPGSIKVAMAIIMNQPRAAELNTKEMPDSDMTKGLLQEELFKTTGLDPAFKEIGWQYNKYYYVVVLTQEELDEIYKQ